MNTKGLHFINGKWTQDTGSEFEAYNPANDKVIWRGNAASPETVNTAVTSAIDAFKKWSALELQQRIFFLEKFRDALQTSKEVLAEGISKSTGKPLWDAQGEVTSMINKIAISIDAFQTRCQHIEKIQPHGKAITSHRAHGVMAVFGPFNFPGHLPNGHIVPALLAGNTIVFKPSELSPLVAELTLKCWEDSGIPSGVINMVQGARETGKSLSEHPNIAGLLFTGSWATGQHFAELMAKTPYKILALEMGGNNPLIVGKITNFDAAAYITIQSAFLTSGQRCSCARRLIISKGNLGNLFLESLIKLMKGIHIGAYDEKDEPFMGPVISKKTADALLNTQKTLVNAGAKALVALQKLDKGDAFLSPGLLDVTEVKNRPDQEYFGPLLQVIRVSNLQEAIEEANNTKYGLTAGLLSDSKNEYEVFLKSIRAGIVNWNTPLTGASSAAPFGGIGQSGNNRPSAFYAADYCSYPVASLIMETLEMPSNKPPGIG
jgi:succinylglutamic semialdehyde dehydrogenase